MARSLRVLQVLIICSVSILYSPLLAMADSVSYQGIALPVTSLGKLGHGQVAVAVFNQAALVSESQVGRRVVLLYTSSGRLHDLSLQSIGELLVAASADGDGQLTVALLTALLRDPIISHEDVVKIVQQMTATELGRRSLVEALREVVPQSTTDRVCPIIFQLNVQELESLVLQGRELLDPLVRCRSYGFDLAAQDFTQGRIEPGTQRVQQVVALMQGDASERVELLAWLSSVSMVRKSEAALDNKTFEQHLEILRVAPLTARLAPSITKQLALAFAERALAQGQAVLTLRIIANLNFNERTTKHHELLLRALDLQPAAVMQAMAEPTIKTALLLYASKDEQIAVKIAPLLYAQAELSQRPAESILLRIKRALVPISLASGALLLLLFLFIRQRRQRHRQRERQEHSRAQALHSEDPNGYEAELAPKQPRAQGAGVEVRLSAEYLEVLKFFNLNPQVSIAEIKLAYRQAVKAVHPDLNQGAPADTTEEFICITQRYERLLELHEQESEVK